MLPTLTQIHTEHNGKISDKWSAYLTEYERIFAEHRTQNINLLEIGVQNGGSLEVWAKYFAAAEQIIGCDINPKCGELRFEDPRIRLIIGDATLPQVQQILSEICPQFDIIIDDGSHTSRDIISAFSCYFDHLKDGGIFVIEDLHCSYWQEFDGGLHHPYSALSFLKALVDTVNHEHWGLPESRPSVLHDFYRHHHIAPPPADLAHIHSIEFSNSVCIIRKRAAAENELGARIVSGTEGLVIPRHAYPAGSRSRAADQSHNPYSKP